MEFALLLPVLMYILMGIMQFGLIFAAYITINSAVREGARWGSFALNDASAAATVNDTTRHNGIRDRIIGSRGILNITTGGNSNFTSAGDWTDTVAASDCFGQGPPAPTIFKKKGDITICYTKPDAVTANDARRGYLMEVTAWYHQQVFVPLLDTFLADDPTKPVGQRGQWLRLPGRVTVVIN